MSINILETHRHILQFRLDSDAPTKYIERWTEIKRECENTDNESIVEQIKNNIIKSLPHSVLICKTTADEFLD